MLSNTIKELINTTTKLLTRQNTFVWLKLFDANIIASTEKTRDKNEIRVAEEKTAGKDFRKEFVRADGERLSFSK
jgi:hypothetical protein